MTIQGEQILFRAYLQNADRSPHTPTYERLVKAARQEGLAGVTVLRGRLGFGSRGVIQASAWSIVQHVPIVVEIVDAPEQILRFLAGPVQQILQGGMVTLERAHVMMYRHVRPEQPGPLELGKLLEPLSTIPTWEPNSPMTMQQQGVLLRVFIGESDKFEHRPLYETIVQKARELGLAGATVLRGVQGFGAHSVVHKAQLLEMSADLPIIIEIVDTEEKIKWLVPHLERMVTEGMITMEHVMILLYKHSPGKAGQSN